MPPEPSPSVLIVEDEAIVALDLREIITELGYTVVAVAASADEAIAVVTARCPDVVLMDIRIHGTRDGIDTAAVMRARFDLPVIYLTAHADDATLRRARETEPYGYLRKPVEPVDLRTALELAIYKHAQVRQRRERERLTHAAALAHERQDAAAQGLRDENERQQQHQQQAELHDRLAALGTLAAGVAHEVNTPLSIVLANASFIQTELGGRGDGDSDRIEAGTLGAVRAAAAELATAAERITAVIADLRAFARPTTPVAGTADVARVVAWASRASHHELADRALLTATIEPGIQAAIDETRLGQVLVHLLVNAAQAIPPGNFAAHKVNISAEQRAAEVVIEVRDSGVGIPPEVLRRVFEPFFTTRDVGQGEGLGLAACHGIVCAAGGRMEVESTPGQGSLFRVVLPATRPAAPVAPPPPPPAALARPPRGRLLVVDDDAMLLRSMKRVLRDHDLVCLESAREALAMLERGERFDLILSDLMMPDLTGMDFYEHLLAFDVDVARRVVFITGGAVNAEIADFLAVVPNTWLEKPIGPDALRAVIGTRLNALA